MEKKQGGFVRKNELLYRIWCPPGKGEAAKLEQLVLPKEGRATVLKLGHKIPLAGHLGREKTRRRIHGSTGPQFSGMWRNSVIAVHNVTNRLLGRSCRRH